jgi:hypothetical protein
MVLAAIFFADRPTLVAHDALPLAIGGACIVTSIIGTFFVKLGQEPVDHGRALQGPDRHRRAVDRRAASGTSPPRLAVRSASFTVGAGGDLHAGTNLFSAAGRPGVTR